MQKRMLALRVKNDFKKIINTSICVQIERFKTAYNPYFTYTTICDFIFHAGQYSHRNTSNIASVPVNLSHNNAALEVFSFILIWLKTFSSFMELKRFI